MSDVPPFNIKLLANRIDVSGSIHAKGDVAVDCSLSVGGDMVLNNVTINKVLGKLEIFDGVLRCSDYLGRSNGQADGVIELGGGTYWDGINYGVNKIFGDTKGYMGIYTNGYERIRIDRLGNVGIGTDSPSEALDVSGNVKISNTLDVSFLDISEKLTVEGNVGIGTDSPSEALDVSGNVKISNKLYVSDLDVSNDLTVEGDINSNNFSFPNIYNIFIGMDAGKNTNTGSAIKNTFVGTSAGQENVTGKKNTFVGGDAGKNNLNGSNNTFIGCDAGSYRDEYNVGHETGDYNVYIGTEAGQGHDQVEDRNNERNICVGYKSGYARQGGNKNIYIGCESGPLNVTTKGGSNNIYIGDNVGEISHVNDLNGQLYIGAQRGKDGAIIYGESMDDSTLENRKLALNAYVGIGTTSPGYPLEINESSSATVPEGGYFAPNGTANSWSPQLRDISIKASNGVWCGSDGYLTTSDQRIKENITEVPDNLSLQKLRDINCTYYEYKDKILKGNDKTIGFIAQQVKEHMPMAVSIQKDIIPNEMRKIENPVWTPITENEETKYKLTIHGLSDNSGNTLYRFYVSNDLSGNGEVKKEIKSENEDPKSFVFDQSWNNVFLYGKEVDDFHILDKQKLFALNFSATQEIDRIQQAEKDKLAEAEAKIATLETTVAALQATLAAMDERLKTLESSE